MIEAPRYDSEDVQLHLVHTEIVNRLIQQAGGPVEALMALAFEAGIAVAYRSRAQLEYDYGRKFTDEEWDRVQANLNDFGDMVDPSVVSQWEKRLWAYSNLPSDPNNYEALALS